MPELLHHPDTHHLGKLDAKKPHAMLHDFLDFEKAHQTLPVPANIINSSSTQDGKPMSVALAMYLNDREGDCTIAGAGNTLRVSSNGAKQITDQDVQTGYVAVTGKEGAAFDPATGQNDNGCAELDVLDHWVTPGIGGDRLLGHAGIDMRNEAEVRMTLHLCGPVYAGAQLSTDQQSQQIWQPGPAPAGSWGGHCPPICDWWTEIPSGLVINGVPIDPSVGEILNMLTWQTYKPVTKTYVPFAVDEGHALMTDVWLAKATAFGLIDEQGLAAYLKTLQQES